MGGLKRDRTGSTVIQCHAFIQNVRRGHYELGTDIAPERRTSAAFDELLATIRWQTRSHPEVCSPANLTTQQSPAKSCCMPTQITAVVRELSSKLSGRGSTATAERDTRTLTPRRVRKQAGRHTNAQWGREQLLIRVWLVARRVRHQVGSPRATHQQSGRVRRSRVRLHMERPKPADVALRAVPVFADADVPFIGSSPRVRQEA